MELPRITDTAARQAIDSSRVFKEYVRLRSELKILGGSMFFKPVQAYEYLVQRTEKKLIYLGRRSPETELKLENFTKTRERLQARFKTISQTVKTSQRMNKAGYAGTVPTEIIEVLEKLDNLGLAERSLVLGSPALYAYGQSAGLRLEAIESPDQTHSLVADAASHLCILVEEPQPSKRQLVPASERSLFFHIQKALSRVALVEQISPITARTLALDVRFHGLQSASTRKSASKISRLIQPNKPLAMEPLLLQLLLRFPKYEQVVIGKTGSMAVMRTIDPLLFTVIGKREESRIAGRRPQCLAIEKSQADLVAYMLTEHMVNSKIEPLQGAALVHQLAGTGSTAIFAAT